MRLLILCLLVLTALTANASSEEFCEKGFATLSSIQKSPRPWDAFLDYFKKYTPKCDDGYYAEGTSDLVLTLLAEWKDFAGLKSLSKDQKFFSYILKNVNATGAEIDLNKIISNSLSCAKNESICVQINEAAKNALKDL